MATCQTAGLLRAFLAATYVVQIVEEGAKLLLRHRPALRRQRLALLWEVLRSGFRINPAGSKKRP